MKKLLLLLLLCPAAIRAQSLSPTVIASSGGSFSNASASMDYTIGEVAVTTLTGSANILTQGFHQPAAANTGIDQVSGLSSYWNIYPNPVSDVLNVSANDAATGKYRMALCSSTGQVISDYGTYDAQKFSSVQIPVRQLSQGIYFFRIISENGSETANFKILKTTN